MEIQVTIEGTTPMLQNKFTDAAAQKATQGTTGALVGDRGTPKEQAEARLYLDEEGNNIVPSPNLLRCIMEGGRFFKAGRSKITTQKSSLIAACLAINELVIPIVSKEPWTVDTRPVRIPATGGRILCHRPMFNDWQLTFTCDLDTDLLGAKLFREIVDAAGKRIGLGDFRPDCKGPYGRFVVKHWKNGSA